MIVPLDIETPRHIAHFDTRRMPALSVDILVIGSGVAGLRAALAAAEGGTVIVAAKAAANECNTQYAQGGIAAVVGEDDSLASHLEDTLRTGCGLCYEPAARKAVDEAPMRLKELMQWGAKFDGPPGRPNLAMEGGHSAPRILHAHGDATGREIETTLLRAVAESGAITVLENSFVVDLLTVEGVCHGALLHSNAGGFLAVWAKKTILAAGGCGQVFRETTNPQVATGDGIALTFRAGAAIENVEFMQFHPTTLYIAGACRFLLSEAMRGEGARLTDKEGHAFMANYHERADLAPRDVVSRSILAEMKRTGKSHVYLDLTHLDAATMKARFPAIVALVESFDIDIATDRIPVHPSAHYMVGGALTDLSGRTTVPNLYAVGEAASTGMHGANRLASNSLLEGLVFGAAAGEHAAQTLPPGETRPPGHLSGRPTDRTRLPIDREDLWNSLQALMWRQVGIARNGTLLSSAQNALGHWAHYAFEQTAESRRGWELQNMLVVSSLIAAAAAARCETRGVHSREDFPESGERAEPSLMLREPANEEPDREAIRWE